MLIGRHLIYGRCLPVVGLRVELRDSFDACSVACCGIWAPPLGGHTGRQRHGVITAGDAVTAFRIVMVALCNRADHNIFIL